MEYTIHTFYKTKEEQTATPSKYPQGYFKDKPCRRCSEDFSPKAPSEHYCSDACKDWGVTNAYLSRTYGITYDQYQVMHESQRGLCKICNSEGFVMDKSRHKAKLAVDHCHETGVVRGLLCHNCNRGLGLFKDSVEFFKNAISYIEGATTISEESTSEANADGSAQQP